MALPPVRLIPFSTFERLGQMPRCPEKRDILVNYEDTVRDDSLYIFMSHGWLRGWPGAPGWDGRPHPDTSNHDKYQLMVAAVEKIMKQLTTMHNCYIWLDYGCIDQDTAACDELRMLDKIIGVCDLILTNVHDTQDWILPDPVSNWFEDYKSPSWNGNDYAYLSRGWTRVEMLYAANIPLMNSSLPRLNKFRVETGLLSSVREGRRPHLLYGTREHKLLGYNLIQLPPMQNSWFDNYNPVNGTLTNETDRVIIQRLVDEIAPRIKRVAEGYEGERNKAGQKHGRGVYRAADGDVYEGDWMNDKRHGRGVYRYADGNVYEGDLKNGKFNGRGVYRYADGDVYEGDFKDDKFHGRGVNRCADGNVYEGKFKCGKRHGYGVFQFSNGNVYQGKYRADKFHGRGVLRFANGATCHDGLWKDGDACHDPHPIARCIVM